MLPLARRGVTSIRLARPAPERGSVRPFQGIIDLTLRDGQQSPLLFHARKYRFDVKEKLTLLDGLIRLGVRTFEWFSPVVSPTEAQDFREIKAALGDGPARGVRFLAHVRCHRDDIEQALRAGFDGLNMYLSVTNVEHKMGPGRTRESLAETAERTLAEVRRDHPGLYLRFSVEDCFRTPHDEIFAVFDRIVPHVQTIGIPDTVGAATPDSVRALLAALGARYPDTDIECHFHNDRGLSVINALTAVRCGAAYIDASVWGLAERSGITSLTALLLNLHEEAPALVAPYSLELCYPVNILMGSILNLPVPYAEPVSLINRTHAAGVHQKAVMNHGAAYEGHDLARFGVTKHQLLLGPLSGWNLLRHYLREVLLYDVGPELAREITREFKERADRMGRANPPEKILLEIVRERGVPSLDTDAERRDRRVVHLE